MELACERLGRWVEENKEKLDILSTADLGVLIFWEEKKGLSRVPQEIRVLHKETTATEQSNKDLEGLYKAFKVLSGGSDYITLDALSQDLVVGLGQGYSLDDITEILSKIDEGNRDGRISFVEFCRVIQEKSKEDPAALKKSIRKLFDHYDRDHNGKLDEKEITKLLRCMQLNQIHAKQFIDTCDMDKDGFVDFEEFYAHFQTISEDATAPVFETMRYWMQLSSGWESSAISPEDVGKITGTNTKVVSFIRHSQSEANLSCDIHGTARGIFNPHITEKGVKQALDRKQELKKHEFKFELIVVSPMRRTLETATHVLDDYISAGVKIIGHPLIREQFSESDDIGDSPHNIKLHWPNVDWSFFPDKPEVWWYSGLPDDPDRTILSQRELSITSPDGWEEPWVEVMKRAKEFQEWLRERPESHICVVSHGGFIEALVGPRLDNAQHCVLPLGERVKAVTQ
eukprot:TRINITY_DN5126_c0_g1_i3.p1 TRINITY_DN5126_c0_g1~~TRINITY_DN5126_c0_g1_i3.p1  ORF type:complete len:457 (-),score=71.30 TRINITY_DN5126_c0_g1_i3:678-2048(-)